MNCTMPGLPVHHQLLEFTQICRWHHSFGRKWRGTKKPLDESERGEWKSWLKAQHSENKDHGIPITSWEIDGETGETVSDFIYGGSKITADGDCSHEIKRCLLLGRKVMTKLDSIFKSRVGPQRLHQLVSYCTFGDLDLYTWDHFWSHWLCSETMKRA